MLLMFTRFKEKVARNCSSFFLHIEDGPNPNPTVQMCIQHDMFVAWARAEMVRMARRYFAGDEKEGSNEIPFLTTEEFYRWWPTSFKGNATCFLPKPGEQEDLSKIPCSTEEKLLRAAYTGDVADILVAAQAVAKDLALDEPPLELTPEEERLNMQSVLWSTSSTYRGNVNMYEEQLTDLRQRQEAHRQAHQKRILAKIMEE